MGTRALRTVGWRGVNIERLVFTATLFASPLPQGLFFARQQYVFDLVVLGLFLAWLIRRLRAGQPWSPCTSALGMALGGLVVASGISSVAPVDREAALLTVLGFVASWCVFVMARGAPMTEFAGRVLLAALVASGVVVAVVGLNLFFGVWQWEGGLFGGRLASTFQYSNTTAVFLVASAALAVSLAAASPRGLPTAACRAATATMAVAFAFAVSRATALGLPIVVLLQVFLSAPGRRLRTAVEWLAAWLPGLALVPAVSAAVVAGDARRAWLLVGAAVLGSLVLGELANWAPKTLAGLVSRKQSRWILIGVGAVGTVAAVVWFTLEIAPPLEAVRLAGTPRATVEAVAGKELGSQTLHIRLLTIRSAMRAALDFPIFGAGGGAWASLFALYDPSGYISRAVHSFPVQLWLETGVVGLGMLLLCGWFALRTGVAALHTFPQGPERSLVAGIIAALVGVVGHSSVDWDLSYLSMQAIVAALLGVLDGSVPKIGSASPVRDEQGNLARSLSPAEMNEERAVLLYGVPGSIGSEVAVAGAVAPASEGLPPPAHVQPALARVTELAAILATVLLLSFTARLAVGELFALRGERRVEAGDYVGATEEFKRAVRFHPWASRYHRLLAQALLNRFRLEGNQELAAEAVHAARTAVAHSRYHANTWAVLARSHLAANDPEAAVAAALEGVRLERSQTRHYVLLGETRVAAAVAALAAGDVGRASAHVAETLEIPRRIQAAQKERRRYGWGREPEVTPDVSLALGQAEALRGEWVKAEALLRRAKFEGELVREADPWLAWVYGRLGRREQAEALQRRVWVQAAWRDPAFVGAMRLAPVRAPS